MAFTDWRNVLNQHSFCKKLRENNEKDSHKKLRAESKGLVAIQNNDLYVWDSFASQLIYYNLQYLNADEEKRKRFQSLLCTDPPRFEVENITFNRTGCLLALWGKGGIMILELPQRWGKFREFEGGKQCVTCKSISVADHFFATHNGTWLLQLSWHPGSETDTHVTFLTSDNMLSTYNILEPDSPLQTHRLGDPVPEVSRSPSRQNYSLVLGDSAASFDFGPPQELQRKQKVYTTSRLQASELFWPVYVVRGNGDVILLYSDLRKNRAGSASKLPIQGPLLMHPPAEDNYGVDACSMLVLGTNPSVMVVATCEGKLHHCVVLPAGTEDSQSLQSESSWNSLSENTSMFEIPTEVSLYVYESVELELSLTTTKIETDEPVEDDYTCPIKLIKDPLYADRYHCTHGAGVHTVVLPWLQNYQNFCAGGDNEADIPDQGECIVEHLICTKPLPSSPSAPVYGIGIVKDMTFDIQLLTLTSDYEFLVLPLRKHLQSLDQTTLTSVASTKITESPLRRINREPFDQFIMKILQKTVSNPLLRSGKTTNISQQECFQILGRTTQIFREEYLQKQDLAQQEINKRVRILRDLREQQERDVQNLMESRNIVQDKAQSLAHKCDDCREKHEDILKRIENVMRKIQARFPVLSTAERNMKRDLENMEDQIETYRKKLDQLKVKREYQERQIQHQHQKSVNSPVLRTEQVKQLREILKQEQDDLSDMQKRINNLKLEAGV